MSASKVYQALTAITGISDHVSDRIELAPVRQGLKLPHIAYELSADDPVVDLSGTADITRQDWNVFVNADTYTQAEEIARLIIRQITNQKLILYATFLGSSVDFDDDSKTYQYEMNYKISYR